MPGSASPQRLEPSAMPWGHRPHLDGLRAVAVYLVVAYHAGLSQFVGGFVGVDLFFVLSGYLVTMVLLRDLEQHGRIRLLRFYSRRTRRLLPAATLAILGTSLACLLTLSVVDRARIVGDATAASLWAANWHFIREASDYFTVDGAPSPFIHFWSLAIEEQFYLAFPLVVGAVWKWRRSLGALVAVTAALMSISVVLQVTTAASNANLAYLATHTRMYQILAGSMVALCFWRHDGAEALRRHDAIRRVAPWLTLAAIGMLVALSTPRFDVSASIRGVGAAAVSVAIVGLLEASQGGIAVRVLSIRPIRYLGEISYGTYLWHWPVFVLAASLLDMTAMATFVVIASIGTGLAALSSALVERPFSTAVFPASRPSLVIAVGVSVALLAGVVFAPALLRDESRPRITAASTDASSGAPLVGDAGVAVPDLDWQAIQQANPAVPSCERDDAADCFLTDGDGPTILLVGDSHARMLIPAFTDLADRNDAGLALSFSPSCPWQRWLIAGSTDDRFSQRCRETQTRLYEDMIEVVDPDLIVVAGFPRSTGAGGGARAELDDWHDLSVADGVEAATRAAADDITDRGIPLLIVQPVPILPRDQLSCLSAARLVGECTMQPNEEGIGESVAAELAASNPLISTIDLDPLICPAITSCAAIIDDVVVRRDAHHLTPDFALTLSDELETVVLRLV